MAMGIRLVITLALATSLAGPAAAVVKFYNSTPTNGEPGDAIRDSASPVSTDPSPNSLSGYHRLSDDGLGTVTLAESVIVNIDSTDVGPAQLTTIFGPGAFVFIQPSNTMFLSAPATSNASGIGGHGPSGSAPGTSAEWGIVSGWLVTGSSYCASSPTTICNQAGFSHAQTVPTVLPSSTYDLGTWSFDATGDLDASPFVHRTTNGGLTNVRYTIQGLYQGSSLPALPVVGFGLLAAGLATIGARALLTGRQR